MNHRATSTLLPLLVALALIVGCGGESRQRSPTAQVTERNQNGVVLLMHCDAPWDRGTAYGTCDFTTEQLTHLGCECDDSDCYCTESEAIFDRCCAQHIEAKKKVAQELGALAKGADPSPSEPADEPATTTEKKKLEGICSADWYEHDHPQHRTDDTPPPKKDDQGIPLRPPKDDHTPRYIILHPEGSRPPPPGAWLEKGNVKWMQGLLSWIKLGPGESIQLNAKVVDEQGREVEGDFQIDWGVCPLDPEAETPPEWSDENPGVVESVEGGLVRASETEGGYAELTATVPDHGIGGKVGISSKIPVRKIVGTVDPLEVTSDENYLYNQSFKGRVFLMFEYHGKGEHGEPTEAVTKTLGPTTRGGGDLLVLHESYLCSPKQGGLLLFNGLLLGDGASEYGVFSKIKCGRAPRYYSVVWGPEVGPQNETTLYCKKNDCAHKHSKKNHTYRFSFKGLKVEVKGLRAFCTDTAVNQVTVTDRQGGRIQFKDMLDFGVVEVDADSDGKKELYVTSTQGCGRWLKVFKVVPDQ